MTRGRMSPAVILALLAVLGFCLGAFATEKPIVITKQASPNAPALTPDPNWDLKEQMGIVPDPGASVPDFDPNGKYAPKKGPAPPMTFKSSYLAEGFEGGTVPPTGWSAVVNNDFTWEIDTYNPYEGVYNATCYYDENYTGTQDEWLISPLMDFEGATSDLKLTFAVMMSYYWGVDPYNNYDVEVWISTDAGATFSTKIWDETALGVFTTWAWYEVVVDLSAYVGEKDVVLGFRYYGYDGAQAGLDAITVDDNPAPSGRCCYGDPFSPSCDYVTELACAALGGDWDETLTCADECPVAGPGDNCGAPVTVTLPADMPYADNNYTCGRVNDYSETCLGYYDGGEDIIYEITVTSDVTVDIGLDPLGTTWTGMAIGTECPPTNCVAMGTNSGSTPYAIAGVQLTAGTYYLMIDTWPSPTCIPEFNLTINEAAAVDPGDNCTNPLLIKLPDDLPYLDNNYTCGRDNSYNSTCLGSYDGGEDIIYELDVSAASTVDIILDPKGTTWTGIAVSAVCPGGATCIATHTNSGGGAHGIYNLTLDPGMYYIMIDTYPSPNCIPDFDLSISTSGAGPENDDCADATPVGDVTDLAFNTATATFDGGGTCQYAANVWYCYTAPCDGIATISLCGSGYDTKLAVYDGCSCSPLGAQLACNDDFCGLQSQVSVAVTEGNTYLIEVGGYGSNTGAGVLNISTLCGSAPPNDNCEDVTPVTLTLGVTQTFTGNNTFATGDCPSLDPGATEAWEAFTLTEKSDVVLDYCGTSPSFELVYIVLADQCPCGDLIFAASTNWNLCGGDGNVTMYYPGLDAGTYYIPVLAYYPGYDSYYYAGPYTINVLATEWVQAYCDASGGCDEYIQRVQVADIDNSSSCEGYGDFTGQIANMQYGVGYPITITIGNAYSSDYGAVWVDWNQDYDFDDAGEAITLTNFYGYGPYTGTITPPTDALAGYTRMRVRLSYYSLPPACGTTSYGEAEDYTINVGGEQSNLTIDPASIDFGSVPVGATGSAELTLGADGGAPINFSIGIEYSEKASYGGGQNSDPTLKTNPFQNEPALPAMEKGATQLMFEGFESGTVPPPGWTAVVNNAFTWEIDSYNPYEGAYNASCFYDETYSGTQDEWLVSPVIDFGGSKYILDFWWMGSYYWSVDPYDNCDLEVWISIDGGSNWMLMLWDENNVGTFTSWTWYNAVVDLSAFKDESNVKLGFHYAGYDGAQFSLDAIGINPAPLSWLSVAPASGSIPAGGTTPITVSYDATDLEERVYEANLVITHTGAPKTVDLVPVTMTVGGEPTAYITPDPMNFIYYFAIDPMVGHMFIYDNALGDYPGYTAADIDPATLEIDGDPSMILGDPAWVESFFDVSFMVADFLDPHMPMWGAGMMTYSISGQFLDATPFTLNYECMGLGFMAGDANLDGLVNIGDAVMLVTYVFKGGEAPRFELSADGNCDGSINIADAVTLVNYIFKGGQVPCHR